MNLINSIMITKGKKHYLKIHNFNYLKQILGSKYCASLDRQKLDNTVIFAETTISIQCIFIYVKCYIQGMQFLLVLKNIG